MARLPNYIVDANPFKLGGPPDYWLQALWDFDPSLVVLPSKMGFFYRIGMRRPPSHTQQLVEEMRKEDSDALMLAQHRLVPVTTLLSTANWSQFPMHMEMMRQRMPSRMGGHEAFTKRLEAQEKEDELKAAAEQDAMLTELSGDAWKLYLKKIGVRSHMYIPRTPGSQAAKAAPKGQKAPGIKVGSIFLP